MYTLKVREYRIEKHWSQEKLAIKSGLSQSEISCIENLDKSPSINTIIKISVSFGICPHNLIEFNFPHNCNRGCNK
ncbi:helix-turn-helix domain-containing protein [Clostridium gasigenes]|uniref:Helix-turn-helix transcriptional regulator n=1 Tax=Clostridium gasigenes TaxID=94869 RepID=A0A7X0SEJ6_9CLOT|nr:helix-turn-helix transcriptional regulator [Clostridium gasigenes]